MDIRKCCQLLDLNPTYSQADLKQAYKDLVQVWHPDRFAHSDRLKEKAEEKLKQINLAYEVLDQALVNRVKFQTERWRSQSANANECPEAQIIRNAYEQSVFWSKRPGQQLRLQIGMLLWSLGIFAIFAGLLGLLVMILNYPLLFVGLLLGSGSYTGLHWLHERR